MAIKECEKCGEQVDAAKAFCPACGNAFVEEQKREQPSAVDQMDGTMQFGKTMYNQMLSDMGLSIPPQQGKPQVLQPLQPAAETSAPKPQQQVIQPVAPAAPKPVVGQKSSVNWKKVLIIGFIAVFLLFLLLVVILVAGYFFYLRMGPT